MNWEAIGAVGEILGAAAVVASLIYLARQLGQNTAMMRLSAGSERIERSHEIARPLIEGREIAEAWVKGESDFASLDRVDQWRLIFLEHRAIELWHHLYQLRQQGVLSDADWRVHTWIMRTIGRRQAVAEAWKVFKGAHEPPFQEFLDRQFAMGDDAAA